MKYKKIISVTDRSTLNNKTGSWRTLRPVIDCNTCNKSGEKCGRCSLLCPECCVATSHDGEISINYDYCKGCGICANECPRKAIKMVEEAGCHEEK